MLFFVEFHAVQGAEFVAVQGDGVARLGVRGRSLQVRADAASAGAKSRQSTFKVDESRG